MVVGIIIYCLRVFNNGLSLEFDYYHYFTPWEFFTSALADGFLLGFERQQVFSSLRDSSQYSGRSHQYCCLDSPHPSRYFQVLQSLY